MTNKFGTTFINGVMDSFTSILAPLTALTFVSTQEQAVPGDTIKVPYMTNTSGSSTFDYNTGYEGDSNSIEVRNVVLDNLVYQKFSINDAESAKLSDVAIDKLARQAGERLANDVISASFASVITNANFPTSASITYNQLSSSLGFVTLVTQCDNAKWAIQDRNLVLSPDAWAMMLRNENISQAFAYGGAQVIQEGNPEKVFGFNTYKTTVDMPNASKGLVLNPNAILTSFGVHAPSEAGRNRVTMTTAEKDGLLISMRTWYDPDKATTKYVIEALFGNTVGNTSALYQLK